MPFYYNHVFRGRILVSDNTTAQMTKIVLYRIKILYRTKTFSGNVFSIMRCTARFQAKRCPDFKGHSLKPSPAHWSDAEFPLEVGNCAYPPEHLRSEISFSRTCSIPNLITSHSPFNASPVVCRHGCAGACAQCATKQLLCVEFS